MATFGDKENRPLCHRVYFSVATKITPAGLEFAVVGVLDQFLEGLLGVFRTVGVLVVLDTVNLYAAVVLRE